MSNAIEYITDEVPLRAVACDVIRWSDGVPVSLQHPLAVLDDPISAFDLDKDGVAGHQYSGSRTHVDADTFMVMQDGRLMPPTSADGTQAVAVFYYAAVVGAVKKYVTYDAHTIWRPHIIKEHT